MDALSVWTDNASPSIKTANNNDSSSNKKPFWRLATPGTRGFFSRAVPMLRARASDEHLGRVPFGESKNGFLILDLPDFAVERNVKSEFGFVTLVTFRQRVQYAQQPPKK